MDVPPPPPNAPDESREISPSLHLTGWVIVALVDVVTLATRIPARTPLGARVAAHLYDAGHLLAMGLAVAGLVAAFRRFAPRRRGLAWALVVVTAAALGYLVLADDVTGLAAKLPRAVRMKTWVVVLSALAAQMVPLAAVIGGLLARRWIRLAGLAVAIGLAAGNGLNQPQNYQGVHLLCAVIAAVIASASLRGSIVLRFLVPASARARAGIVALAAAASAASLFVPPKNATRVVLSNQPSAVLVPFLDRGWGEPKLPHVVPEGQREWFADRSRLPAIPPSSPPLLGPGAIVMMVSVDAMRADLLRDEKYRQKLPALFALRDRAADFSEARSAGASTGPSLAALFAGIYYSQIYWTRATASMRNDGHVYPHRDKSPRFPELLSAAGVRTVTYDGCGWLLNNHGIVRGFAEEESLRRWGYVSAKDMVSRAIARLEKHDDNPAFLYMHLLDAHAPYSKSGPKSTPFEDYLAELGRVDRAIGRLLTALEAPELAERTTLIITADHGEAFGEHGIYYHASTLYDELLRIPLLIRVPGAKPRVIAAPVSLIDMGPTILDLMGVPTPGHYMGQSLVELLRGGQPSLRRPIVAEARLKRAMVLPDGSKVIHDPRRHQIEEFDLVKDPEEQSNLYDDGSASSRERLGTLNAFFEIQTLKRPHYRVPYRKW